MKQLFLGCCWPAVGYRNSNPSKWITWLRSHDIENDGDTDVTSGDKIDAHV